MRQGAASAGGNGDGVDLIMGFATNQSPESVAVFLASARAAHPRSSCMIALVTDDVSGLEDVLERTGAVAFHTTSTWTPSTGKPSKGVNRVFLHSLRLLGKALPDKSLPEIRVGYWHMLEAWHHPQLARWFAYERILRFLPGVRQVVLADVKDFVFQSECFGDHLNGVVVATEDQETFALETWNGRWYRDAFGAKAWEAVKDRMPVCIGVLMGDRAAMRDIVTEFCAEIARSPFGKIEQAVFNRMIAMDAFSRPLDLVPNRDGAVAHLAAGLTDGDVEIVEGQIADARTARVWPVVHMYDRVATAHDAVQARFASELRPEPHVATTEGEAK